MGHIDIYFLEIKTWNTLKHSTRQIYMSLAIREVMALAIMNPGEVPRYMQEKMKKMS